MKAARNDNKTSFKFRRYIAFSLAIIIILSGMFIKLYRQSSDVAKTLDKIPAADRESLEWFFRSFNPCSSYVLFGTKPMSFCCIQQEDASLPQIDKVYSFMDSLGKYHLANYVMIKGWDVWEKYKHLFPSSNYILFKNNDFQKITVFLINKREFLKKTKENLDLFKKNLGADITPQHVLKACIASPNLITEALKGNDALLGILLGFGRHNAELFWRRTQIESASQTRPSNEFSTIDQEYNYLCSKLKLFDDHEFNDLNPINLVLPGFMADPDHLETQKLKLEYMNQFKKILKKYKNKDFLKETLKQYCNG